MPFGIVLTEPAYARQKYFGNQYLLFTQPVQGTACPQHLGRRAQNSRPLE